MNRSHLSRLLFTAILTIAGVTTASAASYKIDTQGMHGFIEFKVSHLGFSIISGRFNSFDGGFSWDESSPADSSVEVSIHTGSVDTNHKERDNHLLSADFLNAGKHPLATFKSTKYEGDSKKGILTGDFTLNGVSKEITIEIERIGEGKDPWGGYRAGFLGKTSLHAPDFGYGRMVPAKIDLTMSVEGIRQ